MPYSKESLEPEWESSERRVSFQEEGIQAALGAGIEFAFRDGAPVNEPSPVGMRRSAHLPRSKQWKKLNSAYR